MEYQSKSPPLPSPRCSFSDAELLARAIEDQIADFLDGRTHGEELLHALHDHVLDEPIPRQMRALFRV